MDKFWKWMKKKKYLLIIENKNMPWDGTCFVNSSKTIVIGEVDDNATEMTKQMLIGYMIEYLIEKIGAVRSDWVMDIYNNIEKVDKALKQRIEDFRP